VRPLARAAAILELLTFSWLSSRLPPTNGDNVGNGLFSEMSSNRISSWTLSGLTHQILAAGEVKGLAIIHPVALLFLQLIVLDSYLT
jgi:hypothetical protein